MARIALIFPLAIMVLAALLGCGPPAPEAEFAASLTAGKVPITIQFTDMSRGDISLWQWDFNNDGLVDSLLRNPDYTFTAPGSYNITLRVSGPGGTSTETKAAYIQLVPPPLAVVGVEPDSGIRGTDLAVAIGGTSLTGASAVSFGEGITVNSFVVDGSTQITAYINIAGSASIGARDVSVTTPEGMAALSGGFTVVVPPTMTQVTPSTGIRGETLSVTITGTGLGGANAVGFGEGIAVNSFSADSPTQVTANITIALSAREGPRDASITLPWGSVTLDAAFSVTIPDPPVITGMAPATGIVGKSLSVLITGANFYGVSEVMFGTGIAVESFTVDSPTTLSASISIAYTTRLGPRDVRVVTPQGTATSTTGFDAIGVSPSSANRGELLTVAIRGSDFTDATGVSFGDGIMVSAFEVDNQSQITAVISVDNSALPGPREVTVTTPDGIWTLPEGFTVPVPQCKADFTARVVHSNVVEFTDLSTGEVRSWEWDLNGDGRIDRRGQNPSFTYPISSKTSIYSVTLTISNPYCVDTLTKHDYIHPYLCGYMKLCTTIHH